VKAKKFVGLLSSMAAIAMFGLSVCQQGVKKAAWTSCLSCEPPTSNWKVLIFGSVEAS
jgi:hypothetical protein